MSEGKIDFGALPAAGPVALLDLVESPSHEARLAFPSLLGSVAGRVGGRIAWAGSIDQLLVGTGTCRFGDILISEYPDPGACARALAERMEWAPENIVSAQSTYVARPWPTSTRLLSRAVFGAQRLLGGGPPPLPPADLRSEQPVQLEVGDPSLGPTAAQVETLLESDSAGRVVMVNFLAFRESARYREDDGRGSPVSGEAAYGRYGRVAASLIARLGGRLRWAGTRLRPLERGEGEVAADRPGDQIVAVEYPSRAAFLGMIVSPRYQSATHHRDAGLARTELLACTSHAEFF